MKRILTFICVVLFSINAFALKTQQAELELLKGSYEANGDITIGLHFKIDEGWNIYWRTPGDNGYPANISFANDDNIKSHQVLWPYPKKKAFYINDDFYTESNIYQDEVILPIKISAKDFSQPIETKLLVDFAICKEICISDSAEFDLKIAPGFRSEQNLNLINKYISKIPAINGAYGMQVMKAEKISDNGQQYLIVYAKADGGIKKPEIFIEAGDDFAFYKAEIMHKTNDEAVFKVPVTNLGDVPLSNQDLNFTFTNSEKAVEKSINFTDVLPANAKDLNFDNSSIILIVIFGFIGGLILNIMPCVLPVLSIKLLSVIKSSGESKKAIRNSFLTTSSGIITSFIALSFIIILLRQSGHNVGWGFHFQEPVFIIFLVVLLTFFAANLWGFYEFKIPQLSRALFKKSNEKNLTGNFLTGVLATILATPCTAPFLGTAIGLAISRSNFEIIATFAAMGMGMASPYLLFSVFPKAVSILPKPGKWMLTVKKIMGWLLAISAVWLIWVLSNQIGQFAALILLALTIVKLLKLWAANHIAFLRNKLVKFSLLAFMVFLAFILPLKVSEKQSNIVISNDIWEKFEPNHIDMLVENGKVVFVDVTADWCLTCKYNKFMVLDSRAIKELFYKYDVVAMQADWTNKDDAITNYLESNNRIGVPFNIIYGPNAKEGIILPELLTKSMVSESVSNAAGEKIEK